ncbi:MAG: NUDIX hydrolase [Vicinamibacterales bacterium]
MTPKVLGREVAFSTPWFDVVAKAMDGHPSPHYTVLPQDYTTVLATTPAGDVLMVRQYRPVVEDYTLELPSGLVDAGETPEACARRELVEETGHDADVLTCIGTLVPDVGRLGNRMFCFVASGARPVSPAPAPEPGLELVACRPEELAGHVREGRITHALNLAVLMLAALRGHFPLPGVPAAGA